MNSIHRIHEIKTFLYNDTCKKKTELFSPVVDGCQATAPTLLGVPEVRVPERTWPQPSRLCGGPLLSAPRPLRLCWCSSLSLRLQ